MVPLSSYKPFVIGQFRTGQFQYLEPWQSPEDAFEPMVNAYTYRGAIQKRQGYQIVGHTGLLRYQNCEIKAGSATATYDWSLLKFPVEPSSVTITSVIATVTKTATDNGSVGFTGTLAGVGSTINYTTGAIHFVASAVIAATQVITICYKFTNSQTSEYIGTGDGTTVTFTGNLAHSSVIPFTLVITSTVLAGSLTVTDDGLGRLIGTFVSTNVESTINYATGAFSLTLTSAVTNMTKLVATYIAAGLGSPIMGINHWEDETTGAEIMTVQDQKRMCKFNTTTKLFYPVTNFAQEFYTITDGTSITTGAITIPFGNITPYTVSITDGTDTITDIPGVFPNGTFTTSASLNSANNSVINYTTGVITITFVAYGAGNVPVNLDITAELQGDYFHCTDTNFFKWVNWKASDTQPAYLYLTNNIDRITLYDGVYLSRPAFPILEADIAPHTNGIEKALDVKVYKNRLLAIRPTVKGGVIEGQVVRFSSEFYTFGTNTIIPFDFVADQAGHGGLADAPTSDWIINAEPLRDAIIFSFQRSTWIFRFTNAAFSPFRWDQINSSRTANAPYGSLNYDLNVTSMGTKGLISCDGVNVDRYDIQVVDQYTDIDNDNFIQCVSQRDDILNQAWMIYPSTERQVEDDFSDKAIIYNFLEKSFAIYKIHLSTIGQANTYQDVTWSSFAPGSGSWTSGKTWRQCNFPWNKFVMQNLAPTIFGGDQNGFVYIMNVTETDRGVHIDTQIRSKRWNPFITSGERCRFGYIDIYYLINANITLQVDIFVNNATNPTYTKMIVLDGPLNNDYAWKRLQVNAQGEFIRIEISSPIIFTENDDDEELDDYDRNDGTYKIIGMILWAMPCGRLVPGGFA